MTTFADIAARKNGNNKGCPRCGSDEKNAGAVSLQLRQLEPLNRTARSVATRCRNLCEPCSIAVFEHLLAEFDEQINTPKAVEALEDIARLEHVNTADSAVNVAGRVAREALDALGGRS